MVKSHYSDVPLLWDMSLPAYILQEAAKHGHKTAIIDGETGEKYTYLQFAEASRKCASALYRDGVRKGSVVCLLSENSPQYPVVFHGTIATGATLVTAASTLTPDELRKQLQDCRASHIITSAQLLSTVQTTLRNSNNQIQKTYVIGEAPGYHTFKCLMKDDGSAFPHVTFDTREDVAVVSYSSGTTGLPKGVMLTHFAMLSNLLQLNHPEVNLPRGTNVAFLPFSHSLGFTALLNYSITQGDTMVVMQKFDFKKYLELIEKYKAQILHVVPPVGVLLAKSQLTARFDLSSLHTLVFGAAPLSQELTMQLLEKFPHATRIMQGYGMTEAGPCTHLNLTSRPYGSCGRLLPHTECKVVDVDSGVEVGPTKTGELWVRGPQLMKGYLNQPRATADTIDHQGWLHTGDIGYYDAEGFFFIVDRIKELIKYKGHQVAPAELEALLLSNTSVADVAVVGRPDLGAGELPLAFVVKKPGAQICEEDIKKFVADQVSSHKKLRGGVQFVEGIPKSPTGKILRRVLRSKLIPGRKSKL